MVKKLIFLIFAYFTVSANYNQQLYDAIEEQDAQKIEEAIKNGANVLCNIGRKYYQILHHAAQKASPEIFKLLLDKELKLLYARDGIGETPLHWACKSGNYQLVQMLLDLKCDINLRRKDNSDTPLMSAIDFRFAEQDNRIKTVELLIKLKANINDIRQDSFNGGTESEQPLHMAVNSGQIEIAKLLLEVGAKVNSRCTKYNWSRYGFMKNTTTLHLAAGRSSEIELIELLIKYKADTNAQNENLDSPLFEAIESPSSNNVKLLLSLKADPFICNKHESPSELLKNKIRYMGRNLDTIKAPYEKRKLDELQKSLELLKNRISEIIKELPEVIVANIKIPVPLAKLITNYAFLPE